MKRSTVYQYYVEGDDEKRLIEVLKTDMKLIIPGRVQILNVVQKRLTDMHLRLLHTGTVLIFVYDTDTGNSSILEDNVQIAKKAPNIQDVYCIPQVKNLEDELLRATGLKSIEELLNTQSKKDFKRDWLRERNLKRKLEEKNFDISRLWIKEPREPFNRMTNNSYKIKMAS